MATLMRMRLLRPLLLPRHMRAGSIRPPNAGAALASPVSATRLSESSARRIAQSVRKSPLLADGASPCYDSVKAIVRSRSFAAEVVSKERRLLDAVRVPVREIYKFVKQKGLPVKAKGETHAKAFNQMHGVRLRCRGVGAVFSAAELELLALRTDILAADGVAYFGLVEEFDGGWRWTFAPAGVNRSSEPFPTKEAAEEELRWLQLDLYPTWTDKDARDEHLKGLIQRRRDEPRLVSLLSEPSMSAAREPLARSAGLSCSSAAASAGSERNQHRPKARPAAQTAPVRPSESWQHMSDVQNGCARMKGTCARMNNGAKLFRIGTTALDTLEFYRF